MAVVSSQESALLVNRHKSRTIPEMLSLWMRHCKNSHKCINAKAVVILLWSFLVSLIHNCIFRVVNYLFTAFALQVDYYPLLYAFESFVLCFYPLAGFLADTKYGRFKMISKSSQMLLLSFFMGFIFLGIIMAGFILSSDMEMVALLIFFSCLLGVFLFPIFVLIMGSLVVFNANIIQFGVDQLQDSPADHQSLFIHWYVWTFYLGVFMSQLGWSGTYGVLAFHTSLNYLVLPIAIVICIVLIFIVVLIIHYKKHWFIIDSARTNPYKLVYRVTKFARQHKVPIRRSAFTYCEDDIPSGLDLGKSKLADLLLLNRWKM